MNLLGRKTSPVPWEVFDLSRRPEAFTEESAWRQVIVPIMRL